MLILKKIKKRLKSKTYGLAVLLPVLVTLEPFVPQISSALGDNKGLTFSILFALAMMVVREKTRVPVDAK